MAYATSYVTLNWTYSGTAYTKRFRFLQAESNPEGEIGFSGSRRDLQGYLTVIKVPFMAKVLEGVIVIEPTDTAPYGTLADLRKAWDRTSTGLTCQRWSDDAAWSAFWRGDWKPIPVDPLGNFWYVPVALEQIS